MDRPTPFDLVFSELAPARFPALKDALAATGADPRDRDALLLTRPAMTLLRELRPDDAEAGAGVDELTALLHHAYLHWAAGFRRWTLSDAALQEVATAPQAGAGAEGTGYLQFPERRVWASLGGRAWEPLDGCFVHQAADGAWRVLGIFGLHPSREGFTVAEATGVPGAIRARTDGTALFTPALEGGAEAGLLAVVETGELVELVARALAVAAPVPFPVEVP